MDYLFLAAGVSVVLVVFLFIGLLMLLYLATKASGRTIGIVLGAIILLPLVYSIVGSSFRHNTVPRILTAVAPASSNKELWDQLTKSRIKLEADPEEKTSTAEGPSAPEEPSTPKETEDQATEKEESESTPDETKAVEKPDWVENPPKRVGNLYRQVVVSELYSTVEECHEQIEEQLQNVVRERIQTLAADGAGQSIVVSDPASFGIGLGYIMREICQDEFIETTSASFGEMKRIHVLMEFSPAIENHLHTAWQKHERQHRLFMVGRFAAMAFSLLAGVYGLLQFDTWTRGYYTKRLLVGVSVAILMVVFMCS